MSRLKSRRVLLDKERENAATPEPEANPAPPPPDSATGDSKSASQQDDVASDAETVFNAGDEPEGQVKEPEREPRKVRTTRRLDQDSRPASHRPTPFVPPSEPYVPEPPPTPAAAPPTSTDSARREQGPGSPLVPVLLVLVLALGGFLAYMLWQSQREEPEYSDVALDYEGDVIGDGEVIDEAYAMMEDTTVFSSGSVDTTVADGMMMPPETPAPRQQASTPPAVSPAPQPAESITTNPDHLAFVRRFFDCEADNRSSCMSGMFATQVRVGRSSVSFSELQNRRERWISRWPQRSFQWDQVRYVTGSDGVVTLRFDYWHELSNSRQRESARMWAELDIANGGPYGYFITGQRGGRKPGVAVGV